MSSRCKNCGGTLIYDIESAKVKCEHCDSKFEPTEYRVETAANESNEKIYETTEFTCPNCGAQISSTEFDAIDYCMYCGSFVSLESQMKRLRMPDMIIPFSKTKQECRKLYKKLVKKKIYAPREFLDESFIEGFKGVYVPYWDYEYSYGPDIVLKGETEERHGDYIHTLHYETRCQISGQLNNDMYDASSNFDDEIALRIAPFPRTEMREFNTSYMFGFYGDTADVDAKTYSGLSDEAAKEELWKELTHRREAGNGHFSIVKPKSLESDLKLKKKKKLVMMPIWFLTFRKKDRISYSVINGATGEGYAEVPVDIVRYIVISLLSAIPIFFLLNCFCIFSAKNMLVNAMILSVIMGMIYIFQLDKLVRRYMHSDDIGYLERHEEAKKASDEKVSDNLFLLLWELAKDLLSDLNIYSIITFIGFILLCYQYVAFGSIVLAVVLPIYSVYRLHKDAVILKDKSVWVDVSGMIFSLVYSVLLLVIDPAPDFYFYYASMLSMAGIGFAAVRMVKRYNQLITRPLPHFFDKLD